MNRFVIIGAALAVGSAAQAATISWGTPTDCASAGDVSTNGSLVEAVNACGTASFVSPTVNGVTFAGETGLFNGDTDTKVFYGSVADYQYELLLGTLDYGSETSFSIGSGLLEPGKEYEVQLWFLDERGGQDARAMVFGDGNGNLSPDVNDQYVIGTFTADGSSQTITVSGTISGPHFTAYQVRDLSSPIPTLSTASGATVSNSFTVSVDFSESVTGLTAGDFDVVNGSASGVSGSGTSWSVTITPSSNGDVTVSLPAGTVTDGSGHSNIAGNTILATYVAPGSGQPIPTLSTVTNEVTTNYTVQVDFSEPVTGLTLGDFEIDGGTLSGLTGSGASYSLVVTPNFGGDVVLSLPKNKVTDQDGDQHRNVASDPLSVAYYRTVAVSSFAELLPFLPQDNITCVMMPGTYMIAANGISSGAFPYTTTIDGGTHNNLLLFSGNNCTYDFTGVVVYVSTGLWHDYDYGTRGVYQVQTTGNSNVIKNLTMIDDGTVNDDPRDGCVNVVMDGGYNRIEGFHLTVKGSYPYGYGDCFGKGGTNNTIPHNKHSAFLIRGESNHAKDCTIIHRSYGHAMFMQAASNPTIEGCYIEGEMRSTDDMLAETSGPAYDIDFLTTWGYRLPPGYMKSTGEGGIRAYNAGETVVDGIEYSRGTSNPTIISNTVVNMRTGVTLTHASGTKYVAGCTTIGCERGYAIGRGIIENCRGDVQYGPVFGVDYQSDSGVTADITIIPYEGSHYNGSRHFAYIYGSNHNLTFRGAVPNPDQSLEINVGGDKRIESDLYATNILSATDIVINNLTGYPLILDAASSGITGQSIGTVTDNGTGNSFTMRDWSVTSNITFYGEATQSSTSYDAPASLAIDQNTSGRFSEGSVTHTANEAQPWWRIDLKKSYEISEIRIWNRTDTAVGRLSDYDVTVFDSNDQPVWTNYQAGNPNPMVSLNTGSVNGQYVMVQLRGTERLSLAEVEIFGTEIAGPGGLAADSSSGQIVLGWNAVDGATNYTAKRAAAPGGPYTAIGTTANTNFTDTTALDGTFYYYVVTATIDGSETAPSGEVEAIIGSAPAKFPVASGDIVASGYQDPNVPANTIDGDLGTRWSANGDGQWIRYDLGAGKNLHALKIAWFNGASRQSSFHIETSDDDAVWTVLTATLQSSGSTTNLETVGVTPTLARYVRIVGHGNTANTWNSITEVELWGTTPSPPPVPTNLTPVSGDGQVALSWIVSPGATLHHLKRSTTTNGYSTIASEAGGSYLDTNVTNGTMYYYVVSAGNTAGESADSAVVSAVPSVPIDPDAVVIEPVEISPGGSVFNLSITNSVLGHNYRVLSSESLVNPDWQPATGTLPGNGGVLPIEIPISSGNTNRFYRLETWRQ